MTYLLDTDTCVSFLRDVKLPVAERLSGIIPHEVFVCSIVRAELLYGVYRSSKPDENMKSVQDFLGGFKSLYFDDQSAEVYARLRFDLASKGKPLGPNDRFYSNRESRRSCHA